MKEEKNHCPICENFAGVERPKTEYTDFTCRAFGNQEMVTDDTLFNTYYLIKKWKTGKSRHPDPELNRILTEDEITDERMEFVKQSMIDFASSTESIKLFRDTVELLISFKDPSLSPLYKGWLNKYFRTSLLHGSTVNTLLKALESSGESVREEGQDPNDWSLNLDAARVYLIETCKIIA